MKKQKMTVKERIQYYQSQGITDLSPILNDLAISPDEINENHDLICEVMNANKITNPKIIAAIKAAERGEASEFNPPY